MTSQLDKQRQQPIAEAANRGSDDRDLQLTRKVVAAAIHCLDELGLANTTVDDIARESSLSRATLYRRFGNKEAIFAAALQQQSRPFESEASAILTGPGSLAERVERLLVWAVIETPENVLLKRLLDEGQPEAGMQIFNSVFRDKVRAIMLPVVSSARSNDELRADLEPEQLVDWIIRELLMIKMATPWSEARLRQHIRHFIKPVLTSDTPAEPTAREEPVPSLESLEQRMVRLEQRLVEVHQLLGQIRQEL